MGGVLYVVNESACTGAITARTQDTGGMPGPVTRLAAPGRVAQPPAGRRLPGSGVAFAASCISGDMTSVSLNNKGMPVAV